MNFRRQGLLARLFSDEKAGILESKTRAAPPLQDTGYLATAARALTRGSRNYGPRPQRLKGSRRRY